MRDTELVNKIIRTLGNLSFLINLIKIIIRVKGARLNIETLLECY